MIHNSLYQFLIGDPEVAAIVGDRVYHEWAPQSVSEWPLLVFQMISGQEFAEDMDAVNGSRIEQVQYQFDLYARSSADAINAGESFDALFRNFRGMMGAVEVQQVELANRTHLGEQLGDKQVRRVSIDYRIFFNSSEA